MFFKKYFFTRTANKDCIRPPPLEHHEQELPEPIEPEEEMIYVAGYDDFGQE